MVAAFRRGGTCESDPALSSPRIAFGARLLLSLRGRAHGRKGVELRGVVHRHRTAAVRRAHVPAAFWLRGDPRPGAADLRTRGLDLAADDKPVSRSRPEA